MKKYTFNTREELLEFLDKHHFKYYIPRVREYMSSIKDEFKRYYVELTDSNEVKCCAIISITDGEEIKETFFDINKVIEFKDTAYNRVYRERKYKEGIENGYF
ncbi:hypothetical protein [Clostridium sp. CCUG 7971]|uniref:hypothetical protein n=1 Tax=Clostridium sp. CCUG 7971 TaxID=2811414 RepID=UPI001ABB131D|nr:hypothetical protein [Clostridium sp. CCUG 7971]MBO3443829.1 hypothetical protein [Clostridium sp. CCUG 7971]